MKLKRSNLLVRLKSAMEVYESIVWIAIGFIPTLLGMEAASRAGLRLRKKKEGPAEVMTARRLEKR